MLRALSPYCEHYKLLQTLKEHYVSHKDSMIPEEILYIHGIVHSKKEEYVHAWYLKFCVPRLSGDIQESVASMPYSLLNQGLKFVGQYATKLPAPSVVRRAVAAAYRLCQSLIVFVLRFAPLFLMLLGGLVYSLLPSGWSVSPQTRPADSTACSHLNITPTCCDDNRMEFDRGIRALGMNMCNNLRMWMDHSNGLYNHFSARILPFVSLAQQHEQAMASLNRTVDHELQAQHEQHKLLKDTLRDELGVQRERVKHLEEWSFQQQAKLVRLEAGLPNASARDVNNSVHALMELARREHDSQLAARMANAEARVLKASERLDGNLSAMQCKLDALREETTQTLLNMTRQVQELQEINDGLQRQLALIRNSTPAKSTEPFGYAATALAASASSVMQGLWPSTQKIQEAATLLVNVSAGHGLLLMNLGDFFCSGVWRFGRYFVGQTWIWCHSLTFCVLGLVLYWVPTLWHYALVGCCLCYGLVLVGYRIKLWLAGDPRKMAAAAAAARASAAAVATPDDTPFDSLIPSHKIMKPSQPPSFWARLSPAFGWTHA